ncbi:chitin binding protein [Sinobacterium caligoides]|uniref:Chitin binding protein n=1 Tax=Sinobacterium caligoides TaxID=933926 RepID=A0A3N2DQ29_9GAMM|nr:lytic polysaccharide monooxygenase auxiliary activity family 9 protein [Sinobacterium caligoides]ROS01792.1 chitin binding protein [Sinobacterium caligoides]
MIKKLSLVAGCSILCASMLPSLVQAHGYTVDPPSRQAYCNEESEAFYWPAGGTGITNAACKAAYDKSGSTIIDQIDQYAINVAKYTDMEEVKKAISGGTVCSANNDILSGIDVASADWKRTEVASGATIELKFMATTVHNPSYWEVYISKPDYDESNEKLDWDDLTKIDLADYKNLEAWVGDDEKSYFTLSVPLPERTGNAVLVTRWQRDDPAGEGFYNCSDITFSAP